MVLGRQISVFKRVSEGRGFSSSIKSTNTRTIFKRNFSDIRKAKEIEFDVTQVPIKQSEVGKKFEGGISQVEEYIIRSRTDLLKKTDFLGKR